MELEIQKLDRKTRDQAKMYYLADYTLDDIAELVNIPIDTVRFYVFGENGAGTNEMCWFQIKKKLGPTAVSTFIKDKIAVLDKTSGLALSLVNENLKRIQAQFETDDNFVLTIDDTKKLAGIMVDMDKMVRLESGKPTDIIDSVASMSIADARRILLEDPFAPENEEVVDVEFEEVKNEETKEQVSVERPWKK